MVAVILFILLSLAPKRRIIVTGPLSAHGPKNRFNERLEHEKKSVNILVESGWVERITTLRPASIGGGVRELAVQ